MERYTEKHYDGNGYYLVCSGNCETLNCGDCGILDKIVDRLAAYEDTGLEPEEIELLAKQRDLYVDACGELPIKRIRELARADQVGHCIVFDLHYPVVSEYYKDEDGLFIREASGVISKEEYEAALRREQDGNNKCRHADGNA